MIKRRNLRAITMLFILSIVSLLLILLNSGVKSIHHSELLTEFNSHESTLNLHNITKNDNQGLPNNRATQSYRNIKFLNSDYRNSNLENISAGDTKQSIYLANYEHTRTNPHNGYKNNFSRPKPVRNTLHPYSNLRPQNLNSYNTRQNNNNNLQSSSLLRSNPHQPLGHVDKNKSTQSLNKITIVPKVLRRIEAQSRVLTSTPRLPTNLTPARPQNVSRHKSPHYPWGNHAFGPIENFLVVFEGTKWKAYFHEEVIAVVLEDTEDRVLNCTLIEIIPEHEQKVALLTLGKVMPLVPLNLLQMVKLNSYCSTSHFLLPPPEVSTPLPVFSAKTNRPDNFLLHASSTLMGILPGTKWCGLRDRAKEYHQLGQRSELDRCCRAHDHCPLKIRGGKTRYGARNNGFTTLLHCSCDEAFFDCLKSAVKYDDMANVVGNIFFNLAAPSCLVNSDTSGESSLTGRNEGRDLGSSPSGTSNKGLLCIVTDDNSNCRHWVKGTEYKEAKLAVTDANFKFR